MWLKDLSSIYLLYDNSATRFQKILNKILKSFVLLVPIELLSHYPDIDISHRLREDVQWIKINFSKKSNGLNSFDTFF